MVALVNINCLNVIKEIIPSLIFHFCIDKFISLILFLFHPVGVGPRVVKSHWVNLSQKNEDNFEFVPSVWRGIALSLVVITVSSLVLP